MSERALEVYPRPASAGTPSAERLVRDHFDFIWRLLRRLGLPEADADDAAQQVFLVAVTKLESIQPGRERAFLYGCAVNGAAKWRGAQVRARRSDSIEPQDEPPAPADHDLESDVDRRRARASLDAALSALSPELRTIFVLFEIEQLSSVEIAKLLDVPRGTIASRLRRARQEFERQVRRHEVFAGRGGDR